MARSYFIWLVIFEDSTFRYVKAQTISQMFYSDKIDMDAVTNITRLETAYSFAGEGIDILEIN